MPNHVETTLTVTGDKEQLATFVKKHIVEKTRKGLNGTERVFDFHTISPCAKELHDARSPSPLAQGKDKEGNFIALERIKDSDADEPTKAKRLREEEAELSRAISNQMKYGCAEWYSFCLKYWGTKWGAYDCYIVQEDDDCFTISYQTAWSPAIPILIKLGTMYPELTFENICVDEGWGFASQFIVTGDDHIDNCVQTEGEIAMFMNEYFGREYERCEKHDSWAEDGDCWECQKEEEEAKDKDKDKDEADV